MKIFYACFCADLQHSEPRKQVVHSLNLYSGRIYPTTIERVHFQKGLGVAEITPESAVNYCEKWFAEKVAELKDYVATNPKNVYMDFEEILEGMEKQHAYQALMRAARIGNFESVSHKGFVACFLLIHAMRSIELMTTATRRAAANGMAKWEYLKLLRDTWCNPSALACAVLVPAFSEWTLWRTAEHTFPLCDSPMMLDRDSVMAVLSPRLLLDINLNVSRPESYWRIRDELPRNKLAEFRRRSIGNTFREIIYHDTSVLREWMKSEHAKRRMERLRDAKAREQCEEEAADRVVFGIGGFGRGDRQPFLTSTEQMATRISRERCFYLRPRKEIRDGVRLSFPRASTLAFI